MLVASAIVLVEVEREGDVCGEQRKDDEAGHDDVEAGELPEGLLVVHVHQQRRADHEDGGVARQLRHQLPQRLLLWRGGRRVTDCPRMVKVVVEVEVREQWW